jgi:hypothetical protein
MTSLTMACITPNPDTPIPALSLGMIEKTHSQKQGEDHQYQNNNFIHIFTFYNYSLVILLFKQDVKK